MGRVKKNLPPSREMEGVVSPLVKGE